jgi:hypothetical protein
MSSSKTMPQLLLELLQELESIGINNEELCDTELCCEKISEPIWNLFVYPIDKYDLPDDFGLYSQDGNQRVKQALKTYIDGANIIAVASSMNLDERLDAFQNMNVITQDGSQVADWFYWSDLCKFEPARLIPWSLPLEEKAIYYSYLCLGHSTINSQIVRVNDEEFEVTLSGKAWQACDKIDSVDGTIEIKAHSIQRPDLKFLGLIHGHLSRVLQSSFFAVEISLKQVVEMLEYALCEWMEEEISDSLDYRPEYYRIEDARWRMEDCCIPQTHSPHYRGGAMDTLEVELNLGSSWGMQDWPLEVSDYNRVEEFCAFYDRTIDPNIKFSTMQLALFSYDDRLRYLPFSKGDRTQVDNNLAEWFDRTLRRDFALHGNTIAHYWAELDRDRNDPEFKLIDPEFICAISGQLRRIWEDSLIPIDLYWNIS